MSVTKRRENVRGADAVGADRPCVSENGEGTHRPAGSTTSSQFASAERIAAVSEVTPSPTALYSGSVTSQTRQAEAITGMMASATTGMLAIPSMMGIAPC